MARVPNLHTIQSRSGQRLQTLASATVSRVRPDRETAGFVRNRDRVFDREFLLRHECAAVTAEIARERFPEIVNDAARHQSAGDVRAADGAAIGLLEHLVERQSDAERVQLLDDPPGAGMPEGAELA